MWSFKVSSILPKNEILKDENLNNPTNYVNSITLTVKDASACFGFSPVTLYQWMNTGRLIRGIHWLKVGRKVLIVKDEFFQWMKEQDGSYVSNN